MGIYYQTVFHPDMDMEDLFIVLAQMDPIIDKNDMERGYVLKEELLKYFSKKINEEDITEKSRITEYVITSYNGLTKDKTRELPIK